MQTYQKLIIYYFSGTGNSRNVASWMSALAKDNNIDCTMINISKTDRINIVTPPKNSLIMFVSPVHGFNYPPAMLHFIMRFPKGDNNVLLMNTRAGMLIGKFITPGLTGIAFYLSAFVLWLKGYSIKAMLPVDLPSNWISLHPGLNIKTVEYLHIKNKEKITQFASRVFAGKSDFRCVREIVQDILISPIAVIYYIAGRFFLSKTYFASHDCDNCDICIKGCPVKAIIKIDKRPYWTFDCESCMKCVGNCPKRAIETPHGSIIAFMVVCNLFLTGLFYKYFNLYIFKLTNSWLISVIDILFYLSMMWLWYRIMHYLLRFKFVERILVYTSLTKLKFWRRYKALRAKQ